MTTTRTYEGDDARVDVRAGFRAPRVPTHQTNEAETPRARNVTPNRERCRLPWTSEVGIDARGAAPPPTSLLARW